MAETWYRAKTALHIGFARAHNPGDLVSEERVNEYGWKDKVEKVPASEAKAATAATKTEK